MKQFEVIIADTPDREMLVAEIWHQDQMIAEINQENKNLELQIYCKSEVLILDYQSFLEVLDQAKKKLA